MNLGACFKMLRVRNWLGYFLISVLGYAMFTKLNASILDTIFFYTLVCLYLGFSFSVNNPLVTGEIRQKEGIIFSSLLALLGVSPARARRFLLLFSSDLSRSLFRLPALFISVFYFSVILELRNHIEDYESDKKTGLRTTACALGINTSKKIAYYLSLLFPLSVLPVFWAINRSELFLLFLTASAVFCLAFRITTHYRILDIYSNLSYFLVVLGVLL